MRVDNSVETTLITDLYVTAIILSPAIRLAGLWLPEKGCVGQALHS